jgi:hypothetical protein
MLLFRAEEASADAASQSEYSRKIKPHLHILYYRSLLLFIIKITKEERKNQRTERSAFIILFIFLFLLFFYYDEYAPHRTAPHHTTLHHIERKIK